MPNAKITSALLVATAAFISMPVNTQAATPERVGKRIEGRVGVRVGARVMKPKDKMLSTTRNKVGVRFMKPTLQNRNALNGAVGKRAIKGNVSTEKMGIRANKLKP